MITQKQIAALKYVIFQTKNVSELAQQLLAFALDASEGLSKPVRFRLEPNFCGYDATELSAAWSSLSLMHSSLGTTHLNELMKIADEHWTTWLSLDDVGCELIIGSWEDKTIGVKMPITPVSRRELELIDVTRPGLYEHGEKAQAA